MPKHNAHGTNPLQTLLSTIAGNASSNDVTAIEGRITARPGGPRRTILDTIEQGIVMLRYAAIEAPSGIARDQMTRPPSITEALTWPTGEGAQGLQELVAFAWRDLAEGDRSRTLEAFMRVANDNPFVGLRTDHRNAKRMLTEGAMIELPANASIAVLEKHAWYLEIEGARAGMPNAAGMWVTNIEGGPTRTRVVALWTYGPLANRFGPVIGSVSWRGPDRNDLDAGIALLSDPGRKGGTERAAREKTNEWLNQFANDIVPCVVLRCATMHLATHGENTTKSVLAKAPEEGTILNAPHTPADKHIALRQARKAARGIVARLNQVDNWPARTAMNTPASALEAVLRCAERTGARATIAGNRDRWEQAVLGVAMWYSNIPDEINDEPNDGSKEEAIRIQHIATDAVLRMTSAVLTQIGRNDDMGIKDILFDHAKPFEALLAPEALWDALHEAGPAPSPAPRPDPGRWWYLEIEHPHTDEPNAYLEWSDDNNAEHGIAIWTNPPMACIENPLIAAWTDDLQKQGGKFVVLRWLERNGPTRYPETASEIGISTRATDVLLGDEYTVRDRARHAIAHYLDTENTRESIHTPAFNLAPNTSAPGERTHTHTPITSKQPAAARTGLFALVHVAPYTDPDCARHTRTGAHGQARQTLGSQARTTARHHVQRHWKHQRHGPRGRLRKLIIVEAYERGPEPGPDQMTLKKLPTLRSDLTRNTSGTDNGPGQR